jgi:hypothetical protein
MGHDCERAAMIYQHKARGADKAITGAIDTHVEKTRSADSTTRAAREALLANGTTADQPSKRSKAQCSETASDLGLHAWSG